MHVALYSCSINAVIADLHAMQCFVSNDVEVRRLSDERRRSGAQQTKKQSSSVNLQDGETGSSFVPAL